jgi:mycothiol synthase
MNQWVVRAPDVSSTEELEHLLSLYHACQEAQGSGDRMTLEALKARIALPGHDPSRDRWVVEVPGQPGRLVGTAWVWAQSAERCILSAAVHPDLRRLGMGSLLAAQAAARAREKGATHLTTTIEGEDEKGAAFLLANGFQAAGDVWVLEAPQSTPVQTPEWPVGYCGRTYAEVDDLSVLVEVMNRCYHDMWGHTENTPGAVDEDHVKEWMARAPDNFIPEGMILAYGPDGCAVGFSRAELSEGQLVVDGPGVAPEHRSMQLQRPLALAVMQFLRGRGEGPILLQSWGDPAEVIGVYQSIGFVLREHYLEYKKDL